MCDSIETKRTRLRKLTRLAWLRRRLAAVEAWRRVDVATQRGEPVDALIAAAAEADEEVRRAEARMRRARRM